MSTEDRDPFVKRVSKTGYSSITLRQSEWDKRDRVERRSKIIGGTVTALVAVVLLAAIFGIRLLIAGGDVRCVFSDDPALCSTVGEVGR